MKGVNQMNRKNTCRGGAKGGTSSTGTRGRGTSSTGTRSGRNSKRKEGRME